MQEDLKWMSKHVWSGTGVRGMDVEREGEGETKGERINKEQEGETVNYRNIVWIKTQCKNTSWHFTGATPVYLETRNLRTHVSVSHIHPLSIWLDILCLYFIYTGYKERNKQWNVQEVQQGAVFTRQVIYTTTPRGSGQCYFGQGAELHKWAFDPSCQPYWTNYCCVFWHQAGFYPTAAASCRVRLCPK